MDSNSELKKAKVRPGIQTRPAQTECHRSTTCATTTSSLEWEILYATKVPINPCRSLSDTGSNQPLLVCSCPNMLSFTKLRSLGSDIPLTPEFVDETFTFYAIIILIMKQCGRFLQVHDVWNEVIVQRAWLEWNDELLQVAHRPPHQVQPQPLLQLDEVLLEPQKKRRQLLQHVHQQHQHLQGLQAHVQQHPSRPLAIAPEVQVPIGLYPGAEDPTNLPRSHQAADQLRSLPKLQCLQTVQDLQTSDQFGPVGDRLWIKQLRFVNAAQISMTWPTFLNQRYSQESYSNWYYTKLLAFWLSHKMNFTFWINCASLPIWLFERIIIPRKLPQRQKKRPTPTNL